MTPEEMRAKSAEKVKQVMALMGMLHVRVEARERVNEQGFIEKTVFWIDDEKYPQPELVPVPVNSASPDVTATGETEK